MRKALDESARRRALQQAFNEEHSIVPRSTTRAVDRSLSVAEARADEDEAGGPLPPPPEDVAGLRRHAKALRRQMVAAAEGLEFERAAKLRDELRRIERAELRDL
jgi:excinuclease ABC subunit B